MALATQTAFSGFPGFVGQQPLVDKIRAFYELYRQHESAPDPLLLVGPDGYGKRTLCHSFAQFFNRRISEIDCEKLKAKGDLSTVLTTLYQGDLLMIREVQAIPSWASRILVEAVQNYTLTITIGQGPGAREHVLDLPPFGLIVCSRTLSHCDASLRSKIALTLNFNRYSLEELTFIASLIAKQCDLILSAETLTLIAGLSTEGPRAVGAKLRRIAKVQKGRISHEVVRKLLATLGELRDRETVVDPLQSLAGLEFESVVGRLLEKMGLQSEVTKASGDGGVDVVAFLKHPVAGGKFLVQCKRFAPDNLVGVPTIRDFYGALKSDREALKGIFITTSNFTLQAREFAEGLPLQLIDGSELQTLLQQFEEQ